MGLFGASVKSILYPGNTRTNIRWVMEEDKYPVSTHTRWCQDYDGPCDGSIRVSPEFKPIRSRHDHRLRGEVRLSFLGELRDSVRQEPSAPKQPPDSLVKFAKAMLERGHQLQYGGHPDDRVKILPILWLRIWRR